MEKKIELNDRLKKLRTQNGLTQKDLSGQFHVSRQTISSWETGRNIPDVEMLNRIAKYYQITLDELLSGVTFNKKNRLIKSFLNVAIGILVIERCTQDIPIKDHQAFLVMDALIVIAIGLRFLVAAVEKNEWDFNVIPLIFIFGIMLLFCGFTRFIPMGIGLQYTCQFTGVLMFVCLWMVNFRR